MDQNENYDAIIVSICNDAAVLAEMWEVVRTLFVDYAEDVIASLTPDCRGDKPISGGRRKPDYDCRGHEAAS